MISFSKKLIKFLQKVALYTLLGLIYFYRYMLKFILVNEGCRYDPSCSLYTKEALETHGIWKGLYLSARRIGRCHPWRSAKAPLYDPVPLSHVLRKDISWIRKKEI
jgi:uncharacterized protein